MRYWCDCDLKKNVVTGKWYEILILLKVALWFDLILMHLKNVVMRKWYEILTLHSGFWKWYEILIFRKLSSDCFKSDIRTCMIVLLFTCHLLYCSRIASLKLGYGIYWASSLTVCPGIIRRCCFATLSYYARLSWWTGEPLRRTRSRRSCRHRAWSDLGTYGAIESTQSTFL